MAPLLEAFPLIYLIYKIIFIYFNQILQVVFKKKKKRLTAEVCETLLAL